jgi:hypothetical protein
MGAPYILSAHAASAVVSRNRRGVMTSECPRRLPVAAQTSSRPRDTRSKRRLADAAVTSGSSMPQRDHEPARGRGVSQPRRGIGARRWTSRSTLSEGCLDDSAIPTMPRRAPTRCAGQPLEPATTVDRGERLGMHRGRASASRSHCGRAPASYRDNSGRVPPSKLPRRRQLQPADVARSVTSGSNRRTQGSAIAHP